VQFAELHLLIFDRCRAVLHLSLCLLLLLLLLFSGGTDTEAKPKTMFFQTPWESETTVFLLCWMVGFQKLKVPIWLIDTLRVGGYRSVRLWSPRIADSCSYCGWL